MLLGVGSRTETCAPDVPCKFAAFDTSIPLIAITNEEEDCSIEWDPRGVRGVLHARLHEYNRSYGSMSQGSSHDGRIFERSSEMMHVDMLHDNESSRRDTEERLVKMREISSLLLRCLRQRRYRGLVAYTTRALTMKCSDEVRSRVSLYYSIFSPQREMRIERQTVVHSESVLPGWEAGLVGKRWPGSGI